MKYYKTIKKSSRSDTIISVFVMLLMLFLPLSSWSGYLIVESDSSSDMLMITKSDMNFTSMPCHSTSSKKVAIDHDACNGECCDQAGLDSQCGGCTHSCTFVKHFSNAADLFNSSLAENRFVLFSSSLINTQFPTPPFRPPAA